MFSKSESSAKSETVSTQTLEAKRKNIG